MTTPTKPTKEAPTPLPVLTEERVKQLRDAESRSLDYLYRQGWSDGHMEYARTIIALADHGLRTRAGQWQPIETAPRGQWLLCGRVGAGSKFSRFVGYLDRGTGECVDSADGLRDPTHWRPLPDAPPQEPA